MHSGICSTFHAPVHVESASQKTVALPVLGPGYNISDFGNVADSATLQHSDNYDMTSMCYDKLAKQATLRVG